MHLKELTINGFKSFAKKGELEFSTPITAIVGPNGSGKSNIAEAFRFVLGEQSPSKMRGKKGEDLIFNGSDSTSRSGRASVVITLDNQNKTFPLDFDEITIERTVYRDGTNEYVINGSKTRLKDVQELLAVANIGSTGHHIISQGEADRILSANPRERREMVEDALGLKVYQYKKIESEKKLKKTLENIAHVELLRKEVKPHLKFLERQVKKIERSIQLQGELKTFYTEYLRREDVYIAHHHDRLLAKKVVPEDTLKSLAHELEKAKKQLTKTEQDEKSVALVALESNISLVRKERQGASRNSGKIEGQISFLKRRIEAREKKQKEENDAPIAYGDVAKAVGSIERSIERVASANDVGVIRRVLSDVLNVLKTLLNTSSEHTNPEYDNEITELADLEKQQEVCEKELISVTGHEDELQKEYQELKHSIEEEHSAGREAEKEVFKIMNEEREAEQMLVLVNQELKVLERDREEFKRELQEAVTLIGGVAARYFEYEISEEGSVVTKEQIVSEERTIQYERRRTLEKMKVRLEELGAGSTDDVMKEYKDVTERDDFLGGEIDDLNQSVPKLEELISDLNTQLNEHFIVGIEKIAEEFNKYFVLMFGGGEAKLIRIKPKKRKKKDDDAGEVNEEHDEEMVEDEDTEEGIEIDVKLPNKRVRGLDMLSGGERALTSIALIFAMSQVNPPLFVILDETDAALDEANSRKYGDMIGSLAERSQLILITHNRETMSRAGVLYGITMGGDGVSKLLSVKLDEAVAVAK